MSKREKLIEKICSQKQVSIEEIKTLMTNFGYMSSQSGSYVTFFKAGSPSTTIPARNQVKARYLNDICEIIRAMEQEH